ncbi:MAG: cytochrome C biogenesis protein, partial [Gammaproteobacteria bacterium]|nr:cytochrome C biogenesis protein [Gammaproteobacteria bacterium]
MSQFVFFAALLALIAVAFAISALWQRSRPLALVLALALPLAAFGLYYIEGAPAAIDPELAAAPAPAAAPASIEDAVAQLQARLATEPDNFEGRVLLARSYMAIEKFEL